MVMANLSQANSKRARRAPAKKVAEMILVAKLALDLEVATMKINNADDLIGAHMDVAITGGIDVALDKIIITMDKMEVMVKMSQAKMADPMMATNQVLMEPLVVRRISNAEDLTDVDQTVAATIEGIDVVTPIIIGNNNNHKKRHSNNHKNNDIILILIITHS